ncbi:hypothetical protein FIV42_13720 [Persicimonas caeni]|uniref:Exo-alpha-sialidase n=1 Tax=Persicimonas caeni TaxID=2292766 RepID=A0A4Y6PUT6_PERCE|nr:sialidase family protein [Persicimonas caeni]QDG51767.1 hypothetical protein FIV42_13720 [Persicimonas caeni]QED32988.1 hypothetical protein FRD00_13715 [Persicimonas caeni]
MTRATSVLTVFLLFVSVTACSDDTTHSQWDIGDRFAPDASAPEDASEPHEAQWQYLGSPPGSAGRFVGRIGPMAYFEHDDSLYRFSSETEWEEYETPPKNWDDGHPRILEVEQGHVFFVAGKPVYLSRDGGDSWQPRGPHPELAESIRFTKGWSIRSDSKALFLRSETELWRSADAGASWDVISESPIGYINRFESAHSYPSMMVPGLITLSEGDHLRLSTDSGQTWQTVDLDRWCTSYTRHYFMPSDGRYLFIPNGAGDVGEFDPVIGCRSVGEATIADRATFPEGYHGEVRGAVSLDGRVVARTRNQDLVRFDLETMRWNRIDRPFDAYQELHYIGGGSGAQMDRYLFELDGSSFAVRTLRGLWQTDDFGETWRPAGPPSAGISQIFEYGDRLVARRGAQLYGYVTKRIEDGTWAPLPVLADVFQYVEERQKGLFIRNGRLFATKAGSGSLYEVGGEGRESRLIWGEEPADHHSLGYFAPNSPAIDLQFRAGQVFIRAAGDVRHAVLPGSEEVADFQQSTSGGGGVWVAPSTDDDFERFGEGLPQATDEQTSSILSMTFVDSEIWVVTALFGVWRADIAEGRWTRAHEGLPTATNGSDAVPVHTLLATNDELYATSDEAIYIRRDDGWERLTGPGYAEEVQAGEVGDREPLHGFIKILTYRSELLAVSTNGIYRVDRDSGAHQPLWRPDEKILTAQVLSSGLYVGLENGLWRMAESSR